MKDNHAVVHDLIAHLGKQSVLLDEDVKERYVHIWKMDTPLRARAVILPRNTYEVSLTMQICLKHRQSVVIHGGLTNLVGSTETVDDDVVISMERMNTIDEVDIESRSMTVSAGVILENIHEAASEVGLLFPQNFGAKGSAQIGGVISTNAGGLRVFRFGMTRNLVLGLEVVLADGTIISSLKKIIKDNSGYDLKQYFIGSEGTLGVVTRAVLKLVEAPKSRNSAFIGINDYKNVIQFLKFTDGNLGGTLSGYELIWGDTYQAMTTTPSKNRPPILHGFKYYVLIESLGSHPDDDRKAMEFCLEQALEAGMIEDAVLADSVSDLDWFWTIREDVHVLNSLCSWDQHFDISLPIGKIGNHADYCKKAILQIPEVEHVFIFGHVADGNIHLIVGKKNNTQELFHRINEIVYRPLTEIGGSVSAEHGIGLHKKPYLELCRSSAEIELMKSMKRALDPYCILNPGKVIDI